MTLCKVPGCQRQAATTGFCESHHALNRRNQPLYPLGPLPQCAVEGCDRDAGTKRPVCRKHKQTPIRQRMVNEGLPCIVEGCTRPPKARRMCDTHYMREFRHGHTGPGERLRGAPMWERLWFSSEDTGYCWEWKGTCNRKGYGQIETEEGKRSVHRVAYELTHPEVDITGLDIHHLCGNKICWRPDHLTPMTRAEHLSLHKTKHFR